LDGYDKDDVKGLLKDRMEKAREDLEEAREAVKALCEPVAAPQDEIDYLHYFCAKDSGDAQQLKDNEPQRLKLYKFVGTLLRAYANIANELAEAGYSPAEIHKIKGEVDHYCNIRNVVRLGSKDHIDLKAYEPAMRHLLDTYIRAEESEKISAFDDLSLIQLIVERGPEAIEQLPKGIRQSQEAVAETIENNVRKLIINEAPVDPAYYDQMSQLLDALIAQRRAGALNYKQYLAKIVELTKKAKTPGGGPEGYPPAIKTAALRSLYNNLGAKKDLALDVNAAILKAAQDDWWTHSGKTKIVRKAILAILGEEALTDQILELAKLQNDYRTIN